MAISRRHFLYGSAVLSASPAFGQSIPLVPYRNYARCLPDYLRKISREAYDKRVSAIAKLTDEASIKARQRWTRETFWKLVGGEPQKTPLNAKVTRTIQKDKFRIECVVFESQPKVYVTGNLYIPNDGKGPFPAVLMQAGHASNGKSYELYQFCCQGLASLGFVVFAFDPMGQGERTNYPGDIPWTTRLSGGADDEHTLPGKQMLLVGDSATRFQTWDAVRALDYLASHPLVDPKRLASTGQSGGGTNTMLLAAVDDRLATAVATCPNSENVAVRDLIPPGATDDAEQNFIGSGPEGFDRWDLLYPFAPKPLLVMVSAHDFAGTYSPNYINSGVEEFNRLKGVYERLGHADRIEWHDSPLPHSVAYELRLRTYNWMRRWLQNEQQPITEEPAVSALTDRELLVTSNGNAVVAFKGETPASLARKVKQERVNPRRALDQLLKPKLPAKGLSLTTVGKSEFRNVKIEAVEVESAAGVFIPAWLYLPKTGAGKQTLLILDPRGRIAWREGAVMEQLAAQGFNVCAADIRGFGNMAPELSGGLSNYARNHATEQHYAWASLILGESLASQRTTDILALVEALSSRIPNASISLASRSILTTPALFAAAYDDRIKSLLLSGGLVSYNNLLQSEEFLAGGYFPPPAEQAQDVFGGFVPGILKHTDLPQIVASIAPRRTMLSPRNAMGKPVEESAVRAEYQGASNIEILSGNDWDTASFRKLLSAAS